MELAALIARCRQGDPLAWEVLVRRYQSRVLAIADAYVGDREEARDLAQEIFLRVFRSLDRFHQDADFSSWLTSVARNHCIDHYRATKREREVLVEDDGGGERAPATYGNPHRLVEEDDRRSLLRRGLERLPPKLREAVIMRDLQELSYQEMAERLSLPEGTVKSRINRGREELSQRLHKLQQDARKDPAQRRAAPDRRV